MRVLFVSEFIAERPQGATQLAKAHYESFCSIFSAENVDLLALRLTDEEINENEFESYVGFHNRKELLCNILSGRPFFINKQVEKIFLEKVRINEYSLIYFDNSYYGSIIKKIKKIKPELPIIAFYHGVYFNGGIETLKKGRAGIRYLPRFFSNIINERRTVRYADKQILLNERDERALVKYYQGKADTFLPIYYVDTSKIEDVQEKPDEFRILFLGGNFWPNVQGITWFSENVMPYVKECCKLYIVGRNMELLATEKAFKDAKNIAVIGSTDDLDYWYNSADIVVGPIFAGEGMKTKTAEAMMYGKVFLRHKRGFMWV